MLTRVSVKAREGFGAESAQQQLRLIEPRGMGRGVEHAQARMADEVAASGMGDMRAAVVHNEMNVPRVGVAPLDLPHAPQEGCVNFQANDAVQENLPLLMGCLCNG